MFVVTEVRPKDISLPGRQLELVRMGFSVPRLKFYAWLVEHGRNPEFEEQLFEFKVLSSK